jgi:hypothetical protein
MIPTLALDPFDEGFLADPYAHHAAIRDAGPVVWFEARVTVTVAITPKLIARFFSAHTINLTHIIE